MQYAQIIGAYVADYYLFALEIIGTVAFSISGAILGMRRGMDLLGVMLMGIVTAVGGGILRDILIGNTPPIAFRAPVYLIVALAAAGIFFFIMCFRRQKGKLHYDGLWQLMDAIGLAGFTVTGIGTCITLNGDYQESLFLLLFVGVVTGVGDGVIRDILAQVPPSILHEGFYASASLAGALCCALLWPIAGKEAAMLCGVILILVLRFIAVRCHWRLPRFTKEV